MMARTHILCGAATFGAVSLFAPPGPAVNFAVAAGVTALGSLVPDIDHPQSTFGRMVFPVAVTIAGIFGHRGITHSIWGALIAMWISLGICSISEVSYGYSMFFLLGYLSHLAGDFFTNSGIPILWPMEKKVRFPITFSTGGFIEMGVSFALSGLLCWLGYQAGFLDELKHIQLSDIPFLNTLI